MKSNLYIFALVLFVIASCSKGKIITSLEEYNLKGEVRKIKEINFHAEKSGDRYVKTIKKYDDTHKSYLFNNDGYLSEIININRYDKVEGTNIFTYQDGINVLFEYIRDDNLEYKITRELFNDMLKGVSYNAEGEITEKFEHILKNRLIISGKNMDNEGKLRYIFENEFKDNLLIKQTVKDNEGQTYQIMTFKRDQKGNVVKEETENFEYETKDARTYKYEYDEKDNWITRYNFDEDGAIDGITTRVISYYGDKAKSETDFMGMWTEIEGNDWLEIKDDDKFDYGYGEEIKSSGKWEIDVDKNILNLLSTTEGKSKKYKYEFEGAQLVLFTMTGKERLRLERKN